MRTKQFLIAALMATTVFALPAFGQEDQPDAKPSADAGQRYQSAAPRIPVLDFKGGTLTKFIDALRGAAGEQVVNIIVPEKARELPVPELQLREIDLYTALRAAEPVSPVLRDGNYYEWNAGRLAGEGSPVYVIELRSFSSGHPALKRDQTPPEVQKYTAVHTITELTTGNGAMSADDVLSALQAALAMEGGEDVKLAYHEETGLIFARVANDQGRVIENTIMNLRVSREAKRENEQRSTTQSILDQLGVESVNEAAVKLGTYEAMQTEFTRLKERVVELEQQLSAARNELNQERSH